VREVVQDDDREQHRDHQFEQVDSIHFQVSSDLPGLAYWRAVRGTIGGR
jgi:hypothetical protein